MDKDDAMSMEEGCGVQTMALMLVRDSWSRFIPSEGFASNDASLDK
jgi:hypothetical protein